MAEVIQNGKTYVTLDVLSERTTYDHEYLRKLAKAKKVDAILIGGTWLMNPDDLERYKQGRKNRGPHKRDSESQRTPTTLPFF